MSSLPPQLEGQVDAPNPIELFWEQYRKPIWAVVVLFAIGVGVYYGIQYYNRIQENKRAEDFGSILNLVQQFQRPAARPDDQFSKLDDELLGMDLGRLESVLDSADFKKERAWLMWAAANRYRLEGEGEKAVTMLDRLKQEHPKHFLCWETKHPPQFRLIVPPPEDEEEKPKRREPEYEPAVAGSIVSRLREAIVTNREFRKNNPRFFKPLDPTGAKIVFKFAGRGQVVVQLYEDAAPEHVESLKKLITAKAFNGQRFYKVQRNPAGPAQAHEPQTLHFGLPATTQDDQGKWDEALRKPGATVLDYPATERAGQLSFFPGMLAAEAEAEGKTSGERFFFNVNDCAAVYDQRRPIIGRVVEGLELLDEFVRQDFQFQEQENMGIGRLSEQVVFESVELQKKPQ